MKHSTPKDEKNKLALWEVALIKRILMEDEFSLQKIHAYFTRPSRSINQARISDIASGKIHARAKPATKEELANFLAGYPKIDWDTGLHLADEERLIKAREAMLAAIQVYNNPKSHFKSELFIVGTIIAWTYLLHAYLEKKKIDIRCHLKKDGKTVVKQTKHGADYYLSLSECLEKEECELDEATKSNLKFLIKIRNEIEHRKTGQIDDSMSAKFQAACENFNRYLCQFFGENMNLGRELSYSLQFSELSLKQQRHMASDSTIARNVLEAGKAFEDSLSKNIYHDKRYAFRVALTPKVKPNKSTAYKAIEIIKIDEAETEINPIAIKEVERQKFKASDIVERAKKAGATGFRIHEHTQLWKKLGAKDLKKGYGVEITGEWRWYQKWLDRVFKELNLNVDE